jgi:hypothetical protein
MTTLVVTTAGLNLRSSPAIAHGNIITTLALGDEVVLLDASNASWTRISVQAGNHELQGFSATQFLKPKRDQPAPPIQKQIEEVHLLSSSRATRSSVAGRALPLSENVPSRPIDASASASDRVAALHRIVDFLDVERSARYQPTHQTFCNIYAYDYTHAANAYLPRVWWREKALIDLSHGVQVPVIYDKTVREMSANGLFNWLDEWGTKFGWQRSFDQSELQDMVNEGCVGVICARRKVLNRSGHITCIVPEGTGRSASRSGSAVIAVLQSQAGSKNKQYFATPWWVTRSVEYASSGFWWHA